MSATPDYREWLPAPVLRAHVACTWLGRVAADGAPYTDRVLPDGCIDLIWDGRRLIVAGPDTGPVLLSLAPGSVYAGLRFRPGMGSAFLGLPLSELLDLRVDARDLLGARADALSERLAAVATAESRTHLLHQAVHAWLPGAAAADARIAAVVAQLREPAATLSIARLAASVNLSERQLHRRCVAAVGYGPKVLQRVFRFKRFLALGMQHPGRPLAELALDAGYVDQAHMNRDCRALAGVAPGRLLPCVLTSA
jgi:AraC-like DNA-binding protein